MQTLNSNDFESCLLEWIARLTNFSSGQLIAVDGKPIRGAKTGGKIAPVHMVSGWACQNNVVLGQVKTAEKSYEITAIPKLL